MRSKENSGDIISSPFHFGFTADDTKAFSLQTTLESDVHSIWAVVNPISTTDDAKFAPNPCPNIEIKTFPVVGATNEDKLEIFVSLA